MRSGGNKSVRGSKLNRKSITGGLVHNLHNGALDDPLSMSLSMAHLPNHN